MSLYGKQWVHGRDRKQLERLARYIVRPPIASERLTQRSDGSLLLAFKRAWKDGTRALVLSAEDLLVRLCAAVPPPFFNMIRYYGVLSSHSAYRSRVVLRASDRSASRAPPASGDQLEFFAKEDDTFLLVPAADHLEQKVGVTVVEGEKSDLVNHEKLKAGEMGEDLTRRAVRE